MQSLIVSFKNCRKSPEAEELVRLLIGDALAWNRQQRIRKVFVTISEENGPRTPGADVYNCQVVAITENGVERRLNREAETAEEAVGEAAIALREDLIQVNPHSRRDRIPIRTFWRRPA